MPPVNISTLSGLRWGINGSVVSNLLFIKYIANAIDSSGARPLKARSSPYNFSLFSVSIIPVRRPASPTSTNFFTSYVSHIGVYVFHGGG